MEISLAFGAKENAKYIYFSFRLPNNENPGNVKRVRLLLLNIMSFDTKMM